MFGFLTDLLSVPVAGAYHLVSAIGTGIHPLFGEFATAAAIVLFTVAVRALLHPLARGAVRGERTRAALAPRIGELRAKHRNDPQRLQRELAELQAETGSLFAGCLPMFAQLPFFMVLYRLFALPAIGGEPNALLGHTLFGAPLGGHFWPALTAGSPHLLVFGALFLGLGTVAWCTVRWQARQQQPAGHQQAAHQQAAQQQAVQRLMRLLPYGTILAAAVLPLAAGVYLLTTTTWTAVERAALRRQPVVPSTTG